MADDKTAAGDGPADDEAELDAMRAVAGALKPLTALARRRVITWAASKYDIVVEAATAGHTAATGSTHGTGRGAATPKNPAGNVASGRAGRAKGQPTADKSLDLEPKGGMKWFADFVDEKKPKDNQHDHNVVALYWLTHVVNLTNVGLDKVYTCYRGAGWNLPADFRNSLQKTGSIKTWVDSKNADDLKVTPMGINYVERQLPPRQP